MTPWKLADFLLPFLTEVMFESEPMNISCTFKYQVCAVVIYIYIYIVPCKMLQRTYVVFFYHALLVLCPGQSVLILKWWHRHRISFPAQLTKASYWRSDENQSSHCLLSPATYSFQAATVSSLLVSREIFVACFCRRCRTITQFTNCKSCLLKFKYKFQTLVHISWQVCIHVSFYCVMTGF